MTYIPSSASERHLLRLACRLWRLQTEYVDMNGELVRARPKTLIPLLEALSNDSITDSASIQRVIDKGRSQFYNCILQPVNVHWLEDKVFEVRATLPSSLLNERAKCRLKTEDGSVHEWEVERLHSNRVRSFKVASYASVKIQVPVPIPIGYHDFSLAVGKTHAATKIFAAPKKIGGRAKAANEKKSWGLFTPLYALRNEVDWGIGDVSSLEVTQKFVADMGGLFVGTLPLLASANEGVDWDPSPYSPVSRLFWNEIYLDVGKLAQERRSTRAQSMIEQPGFKARLGGLREREAVDYASVLTAKKEILTILASEFFEQGGAHDPEYSEFVNRQPLVKDFAALCARCECRAQEYFLYVQFEMDRALRKINERVKRGELAGLYLDFPVGVARGGFDSSEFKSNFVDIANAGAPPDLFFSGGQNWGFAPLHPICLRDSHYKYFIACIRNHMQYARVLRLDHIMAFHRIYAIPNGVDAKSGAYIKYYPDEFYALLSIEADRACVRVVGEDLGTVPEVVRKSLQEHDCLRMWVLPFEVGGTPSDTITKAPERSLACLNTHDMAPFKGYWQSRDLALFDELKVLEHSKELGLHEERVKAINSWIKDLKLKSKAPELETFHVFAELIARSPAELMLLNLEDLWAETEPQNIPGTWKEYPNWRRKHRLHMDDWTSDPNIQEFLTKISTLRSGQERKDQGSDTSHWGTKASRHPSSHNLN